MYTEQLWLKWTNSYVQVGINVQLLIPYDLGIKFIIRFGQIQLEGAHTQYKLESIDVCSILFIVSTPTHVFHFVITHNWENLEKKGYACGHMFTLIIVLSSFLMAQDFFSVISFLFRGCFQIFV